MRISTNASQKINVCFRVRLEGWTASRATSLLRITRLAEAGDIHKTQCVSVYGSEKMTDNHDQAVGKINKVDRKVEAETARASRQEGVLEVAARNLP